MAFAVVAMLRSRVSIVWRLVRSYVPFVQFISKIFRLLLFLWPSFLVLFLL